MNVVLLRVGIDTGSGGMHGPLFRDGIFEYIPIPDNFDQTSVDSRTYGNTRGRFGRKLIEYFPESRRKRMKDQSIHFDPEFETFTYGDPTNPKAGLRRLAPGDLLVFYCGLQGWDFSSEPALYLMGYFEVERAGSATDFSERELNGLFCKNFHVRHEKVFRKQKDKLVLVKGNRKSRLLKRAKCVSTVGRDRSGRPIKVLSKEMQRVFGDFGGKISIQRSPPRTVDPAFVGKAAEFVMSLE